MRIGETLAMARQQAGLSVAQVSERTRIRESIISSIERGDFSACGGDFYARGHIRAIAKVVGADGEPLIRDYDVLYRPRGAASVVSLEELLSAAAQTRPRSRPARPEVWGLVASAAVSAWRRVHLTAVRVLATRSGRRVSRIVVLGLAVMLAAGFGLNRLLSGSPQAGGRPAVALAHPFPTPDSAFSVPPAATPSSPAPAEPRRTLGAPPGPPQQAVRPVGDQRSPHGRPAQRSPHRHPRPERGHPYAHAHGRTHRNAHGRGHAHGHGHAHGIRRGQTDRGS